MRTPAYRIVLVHNISIPDILVGFPITHVHDGTYTMRRYWKKVLEEDKVGVRGRKHEIHNSLIS
jgi:hypothetical protein